MNFRDFIVDEQWLPLFYHKRIANQGHQTGEKMSLEFLYDNMEMYEILCDEDAIARYNDLGKKVWQIPPQLDKNFYKPFLFLISSQHNVYEKHCVIFVNYMHIMLTKEIPQQVFFRYLLREHIGYSKRIICKYNEFGFVNEPIDKKNGFLNEILNSPNNNVPGKLDTIEELKVDLYDYQKENIKWMLNCEKKGNMLEFKKKSHYPYKIRNIYAYYDRNIRATSKNCNLEYIVMRKGETKNIILNGGILADQVGLGKTITTLGLSLSNKSKHPINYDYKKGNKLYSWATVIICPSQLCGQWKQEIIDNVMYDKTKTEIKQDLIVCLTKTHLKKYSYIDLCNAQYVIISFNYLKNPAYVINLKKNIDQNEILYNTYVDLSKIHWHRIAIDEFHELNNCKGKNIIKEQIDRLKSTYRWCVSGTPFSDTEKGLNTLAQLLFQINDLHLTVDLHNANYKSIIRRNTKESVVDEFKLPDIEQIVKYLDFTPTERNMYDAHIHDVNNDKYDPYIRKLCCQPSLARELRKVLINCKSMQDVEIMMIKHYDDLVKSAEQQVTIIDCQLKASTSLSEINRLEKMLSKKKKELNGVMSSRTFFNTAVNTVRTGKLEECCVCLEDIGEGETGITTCGHTFCYTCLDQCVKTSGKCPSCRKQLKKTDYFKLKENKKKEDDLVNKIGTKLAALVRYLRKQDEHCIIFSQWHDLLISVGRVLDEQGIKNIFCKGNAYHRNAAINRFNRTDEYKVIMLSSENAASGTNLTKASQIIFLDPVYGSPEYRKDIEGQAIARAHRMGQTNKVKVVRFIIKNTIEQEIHKENWKSILNL